MTDSEQLRSIVYVLKELRARYPSMGILSSHEESSLLKSAELIEVAENYNMNINDFIEGGVLRTGRVYRGHDFILRRPPYCTNRTTKYKFAEDEYIIQLTNGNVGRFAFNVDDYSPAANKVYDDFKQTILSYAPLEYDDCNFNYIFDISSGYKLYKDFPDIAEKTQKQFDVILKQKEIERLREKLTQLEGDVD